jgi:hypothetical protein
MMRGSLSPTAGTRSTGSTTADTTIGDVTTVPSPSVDTSARVNLSSRRVVWRLLLLSLYGVVLFGPLALP